MKKKSGRTASFLIIAAVYLFAFILGVFVFNRVSGQIWYRILISDIAATVFVFIFSCVFSNASVYDPYWSVQPLFILIPMAVTDATAAKILLISAVIFWGVRLTVNWAFTFHGLEHQDWRYTKLKEQTGRFYFFVNFAGIHMFPTVVVFLCILPAIFVMEESPAFTPLCLIGFLLSCGAVCLQLVSDVQMLEYRAEKKTPFIETGLWKYARHPNYLGEILMWWGVSLYSVSLLGFRWYLLAGAAVNTLMFLFISIPMADRRQAVKPGYEEYAKGKNTLLPLKTK